MRCYLVSSMAKGTYQEHFPHREGSIDGNRQGLSSKKCMIVIPELAFPVLRERSFLSYIHDRCDETDHEGPQGLKASISQDEEWPRREGTSRGLQKRVIWQANCRFRKTGYAATLQFDPNNATAALLRTKGRKLILYR